MRYPGRPFEDFTVGQVFELPTFCVSRREMYEFCELTGDNNPLHDVRAEEFHEKVNIFKIPIVPGVLTFAKAIGVISRAGVWDGTCLAFLKKEVGFTAPVMPSEALFTKLIVLEKIPGDQVNRGIIRFGVEVSRADKVVLVGKISILIAKKSPLGPSEFTTVLDHKIGRQDQEVVHLTKDGQPISGDGVWYD